MSTRETVKFETDGSIAVITIVRPPYNSTTVQVYEELAAAFEEAANTATVRAIILTGHGESCFTAGADLESYLALEPKASPGRNMAARKAFWGVHDCLLPVVCALNGLAAGAGVAMAASCDVIVAADSALLFLPEIDLGLFGAAHLAARIVPEMVMRRMYLTGEPITMAEAKNYGAVAEVVPLPELMAAARRWALKLAEKDPLTYRESKRCLNQIEHMEAKAAFEKENEFTIAAMARPETKQLIRQVVAAGGTAALGRQRLARKQSQ